MTPEQNRKLTAIEEKLLNVFIDEADPDTWPKVDKTKDKDHQQAARGDRYWSAKTANQTLALLTRIVVYRLKLKEGQAAPPVDEEKQHASDMRAAEKKVNARLSLVKKRAC